MAVDRYGHTATLLPTGKVLITGGTDSNNNSLDSAEIYDPASDSFSATGTMARQRSGHTATLLANGKVLIADLSANDKSSPLDPGEIYDPATGAFTPTDIVARARSGAFAVLLPSGKMLLAGGLNSGGAVAQAILGAGLRPLAILGGGGGSSPFLSLAEIYDPATGFFTTSNRMAYGLNAGAASATLLKDGRVLFGGGLDASQNPRSTVQFYANAATGDAPSLSGFSASPAALAPGGSTTFTWTVVSAASPTLTLTGPGLPSGGQDVTGLTSYNLLAAPQKIGAYVYTLSASNGFGPATPGFRICPYGDIESLCELVSPNTCAILVEPIQGEGGIIVPPKGFLKTIRDMCDDHRILLITDEIQSGLGRTGRLFAFEHEGIRPDGATIGKALSGGFYPISAFLASKELMSVFTPGIHGSTFGGNPLACAVASAALDVIVDEQLVLDLVLLECRGNRPIGIQKVVLIAGQQAELQPGIGLLGAYRHGSQPCGIARIECGL